MGISEIKPIEMKLSIALFAFAVAQTEDKPAVSGDDGKWTKCEEPAAVENGKVRCKKDVCMVKCDEGFMVEGSMKAKCMKQDDDTFAFNKELGTCDACPDEGCPEMEKPDKPSGGKPTGGKPDKPSGGKPTGDKPTGDKPTGDKPTGGKPTGDKPTGEKPPAGECKDFATMLGDDSVFTTDCAANDAGKMSCDVQCPDGTFFMGKDGKTGTSVTCKCKGSKCKWVGKNKKTVNGKIIAKWMCE